MWRHLLEIYQESRLNAGTPACLFAETLIFNEGWLLRSVLQAWKVGGARRGLPFLVSRESVARTSLHPGKMQSLRWTKLGIAALRYY